jgi:hypothetical protein
VKWLVAAILLSLSSLSFPADVTMSWVIPVQRENGDVLTVGELGGYRIYSVAANYVEDQVIVGDLLFEINGGANTALDIDNTQTLVPGGLVYLAMTAFDNSVPSLESRGSNMVAVPANRLLAPGFNARVLFGITPPIIPPVDYPAKTVVYSYYLDTDGSLIDPLPLSGVILQKREPVYFAVVGDYADIKYYCCKVGSEPHMPMQSGLTYTVDLSTLPADGGLPRELYFDIVTHEGTVLQSNSVNWSVVGE